MKLVIVAALLTVSFAIRPRSELSVQNSGSEVKHAAGGILPRTIVSANSTFDRRSRTWSALTGQLAKDTCNVNGPNTLQIEFPMNARWAYAGVSPDPNYLCISTPDSPNPEYEILTYAFDYSYNKTSCYFDHNINGCWFAFAWQCLDPVLRQDIFDSQICTFQGTPQEVADRLSAAINRLNYVNYMVVAVHLDSFEAWSSPWDDNMCSVFTESTDFQIIVAKVAVR